MSKLSFARFGSTAAYITGLAAFLYAVSFIIISRQRPDLGDSLSALFLLLQGLFASAVVIALYHRLKTRFPEFAPWVAFLGLAGALGAAIHGGYDLANAINPPFDFSTELPSQVDPRGLLTFGFSGLSMLGFGRMIKNHPSFPDALANLGYFGGMLLMLLYLGRLIILEATSPAIVLPALLSGFVVLPLWYFWLGRVLKK